MRERHYIGDMELNAYLDGEMETSGRLEVEAWLANHPEDAARLAAWRRHKEALARLAAEVLEEPVPAKLAIATKAGARRRGWPWRRIAAALALLVAGSAAGWFGHGVLSGASGSRALVARAVGAYAVFSPERRHPVEVWADKEEKHLVTWLSRRLGHPVKPPPLADLGFRLVGGRLVTDDGSPAALYMYEDADKRRITLYVRRARADRPVAFRFAEQEGTALFYWIEGPLAYAIAGRMPRTELLGVARVAYRSLHGPGGS